MFCIKICIGNRINFTIDISWSRMTPTYEGWILISGFFLSPRRLRVFHLTVMKRISRSYCQFIIKTAEFGDQIQDFNYGIEVPLNDKKGLVRCAISAKLIFDLTFFSDKVNKYNYMEMVWNFFLPKLLRTANYLKYYIQQDGATSHTASTITGLEPCRLLSMGLS